MIRRSLRIVFLVFGTLSLALGAVFFVSLAIAIAGTSPDPVTDGGLGVVLGVGFCVLGAALLLASRALRPHG